MGQLSISHGNSKLGAIPSVSLPSVKTCRVCACQQKCYAKKLERLRPSVAKAYQKNLDVLNHDPDTYWREVEGAIMMSRYFRFHVSGDIPDEGYFRRMVEMADRNRHCEILCFTKRYELVNDALCTGLTIPPNLHLFFSAWPGLPMDNPFSLPEAHVRFRDGSATARPDAVECGGNCTTCAITGEGCWALKRGQQVVFNEH